MKIKIHSEEKPSGFKIHAVISFHCEKIGLTEMSFSFLSGDSFEIVHVGGADGRSDDSKVIDLSDLFVSLIVLEEKLQVCHVLELDELQRDGGSLKLLGCQSDTEKCWV